MLRSLLTVVVVFIIPAAHALEGVSLTIESIAAEHWQIQGVQIALTGLAKTPQQLALTINSLALPEPFHDLKLVNIRCSAFTWQNKALSCQQGKAQLRSKQWHSPSANFSFQITEKHSKFHLDDVRLAGARFTVDGEETGEQWQLRVTARAVSYPLIQQWLPAGLVKVQGGSLGFRLRAAGSAEAVHDFTVSAKLDNVSGQSGDGRFAAETLKLETQLAARNHRGLWQWQSHSAFKAGALYIEPLYLPVGAQTMVLDAEGDWDPAGKRIEVRSAHYRHPRVAELNGSALIQTGNGLNIEQAQLSLSRSD
jgi:hypothetical protein